MKIKMLTGMAGADFSLSPGDETERFGKDEAARLIQVGFAVPVTGEPVERATKKPPAERRG